MSIGRFGEHIEKTNVVIGGRTKRDGLPVSKDAPYWPGPSSYIENVNSLYERMILKNIKLNGGMNMKSSAFMRCSNSEEHLQKLKEK